MKLETETLNTNRLILRKVNKNDCKLLFDNVYKDPLIYKYNKTMTIVNNYKEMDETIDFFLERYNKNQSLDWTVIEKSLNEPIGMIFIYNINEKNPSLTISYFFGSKYWNKGYGVESLKEAINYCKSKYNFKKLIATCLKENYPSNKLLHKLGFSHIKEDNEKIYYELKL